jgi:diguanylate cyclase
MLRQARQREELEIERARTEADLLFDPLTGLGNRRRFDQVMAAIDAGLLPEPTSMLIVDVDKFKAINDTHSHSAGDYVLRELGTILKANCRPADPLPIRYEGDEFVVFLHGDLPTAVAVAKRIRQAVATADFDNIIPGTPVTVSAGVAMQRPGMTAAELYRTANTNLYRAKRDGRDRIVG